uniref:Peroxisomal membrane protein 11A n=1 Tax=Lygus hesperus TaxID=30085 RepID=A0A0A9VPE4_LYGHE
MSSNHVDNFPPFVSKYTLTALTNCLQKNNGRSNLFKFAQYFTKLMAIKLSERDNKDPNIALLLQASLAINTSRKMMTLGSWIDTLEANRYQGISTHKDRLRKLSNYIHSVYLIFDNIVFLQRVKATDIFGSNAARIGMCAFWFAQLFALMADFIALYETFEKEKALADVSKNPADFRQLRLGRTYSFSHACLYMCIHTNTHAYRLLHIRHHTHASL